MNDKVVIGGEVGLEKIIDGTASMTSLLNGEAMAYLGSAGKMQGKEVVPSEEEQVILPDSGYAGLNEVRVAAIPSNYGLITWNGVTLTVS